ncbi:MAG: ATP-dependent DNA helicase [Planctomycetes bacterium]|nr:ATP-dependent DNA helicase [Planctomycetota bacterium]
MQLSAVLPDTPLSAVCSHEQWGELYVKMAASIRAQRTTLVFVGTRKQAERLAARLSEELGRDKVACHHGSLSKETRLAAEQRLKQGDLSVLVATASLELGIDIGDVDLVMQVGSPRSIATFLQRAGRAGHGVARTPKADLYPLTLDEAVEAIALLHAIRHGRLDRTPEVRPALDILAQQIVAACTGGEWREDDLFECFRRAHPYRELTRADFDAVVSMHTRGRNALLHRDGVAGRVMATKRARMSAIMSGGAIPDNADYKVLLEPEDTVVGTLHEDFAIEASRGDVFQLGNASWQILKIEPGIVRVSDAAGAPPTVPFWIGEAPTRTRELAHDIGRVREAAHDPEWSVREAGAPRELALEVARYLTEGRAALGCVPTQDRLVLERFFDESGGQQLVLHSLFGGRINRALGLALRKRFCRGFGFELQAAANEEALVLSLGNQHSFELAGVFRYLDSRSARELLIQALLAAPMFITRWRWNVGRALLLPRVRSGRRVPPPIQRMRAEDMLADAFPQAIACGETLPAGDIEVPGDHPIVTQTIEDCLHEAMDIDGFLEVLRRIESGDIDTIAIDRPEPSAFAHGILTSQPYTFLDDAPIEERRTQAVQRRRSFDAKSGDPLGELDPSAIQRVRDEAWPEPQSAEELHEALSWMGFATDAEAAEWSTWIGELARDGRVEHVGARWFAAEAPRTGKEVLRGRLEALGPVDDDDPLIREFAGEVRELESEGAVLAARFSGKPGWCQRHLLARIHRYTLDRLRREIEAVSAADFLRFLCHWQHAIPERRLDGPRGLFTVIEQLAGFQAPAEAWERHILPARVRGYQSAWLDGLALSGEIAWGRLWGCGSSAARTIPVALIPRAASGAWFGLAGARDTAALGGDAQRVHDLLVARGASFHADLLRASRSLPSQLEAALCELVAAGLVTGDAFSALRNLFTQRRHGRRRAEPAAPTGRWSLVRTAPSAVGSVATDDATDPIELVARTLLARTGVVFRRTFLREKIPVAWRDLLAVYRRLEARGEIHGGRFVAGFHGEQYALKDAVSALRVCRKAPQGIEVRVIAADPLNYAGILTPEERVASNAQRKVIVAPPPLSTLA